jgi:hypothetical protein
MAEAQGLRFMVFGLNSMGLHIGFRLGVKKLGYRVRVLGLSSAARRSEYNVDLCLFEMQKVLVSILILEKVSSGISSNPPFRYFFRSNTIGKFSNGKNGLYEHESKLSSPL